MHRTHCLGALLGVKCLFIMALPPLRNIGASCNRQEIMGPLTLCAVTYYLLSSVGTKRDITQYYVMIICDNALKRVLVSLIWCKFYFIINVSCQRHNHAHCSTNIVNNGMHRWEYNINIAISWQYGKIWFICPSVVVFVQSYHAVTLTVPYCI